MQKTTHSAKKNQSPPTKKDKKSVTATIATTPIYIIPYI